MFYYDANLVADIEKRHSIIYILLFAFQIKSSDYLYERSENVFVEVSSISMRSVRKSRVDTAYLIDLMLSFDRLQEWGVYTWDAWEVFDMDRNGNVRQPMK